MTVVSRLENNDPRMFCMVAMLLAACEGTIRVPYTLVAQTFEDCEIAAETAFDEHEIVFRLRRRATKA